MDLGWGDFFGNLVQSNGENDGHESDDDILSFSHENPLQKTETWARTSTEYYEGLTAMEMEDIMDQVSAGAQSNGGSFEDDDIVDDSDRDSVCDRNADEEVDAIDNGSKLRALQSSDSKLKIRGLTRGDKRAEKKWTAIVRTPSGVAYCSALFSARYLEVEMQSKRE